MSDGITSATEIIDGIEKPLRHLVRVLNEHNFKTTSSCGHYPRPYIQLEWKTDNLFAELRYFLHSNGYRRFSITVFDIEEPRTAEITFYPKQQLVDIKEIRKD